MERKNIKCCLSGIRKKREFIVKKENNEEMLPEYDFSNGIRGKYSKRYAKVTNVLLKRTFTIGQEKMSGENK